MATSQASPTNGEYHPVLVDEPGAVSARQTLDGSGLQIGIVWTREHGEIVDALVEACRKELLSKGVARDSVHEAQVALPFELPYAIKQFVRSAPVAIDAVVCVGCLVQGDSLSYRCVGEAVTRASLKVSMVTKTPIVYGVLTCTTEEQARECAGFGHESKQNPAANFGVEWAQTAIDMARITREVAATAKQHCGCKCH